MFRRHIGALGSRVVWKMASSEGKSVAELQPRSAAAEKLRALGAELELLAASHRLRSALDEYDVAVLGAGLGEGEPPVVFRNRKGELHRGHRKH